MKTPNREICECGHLEKIHLRNREDENKFSGTNARIIFKNCKVCPCKKFKPQKSEMEIIRTPDGVLVGLKPLNKTAENNQSQEEMDASTEGKALPSQKYSGSDALRGFNLSEKFQIIKIKEYQPNVVFKGLLRGEDVKEFIKRLKEVLDNGKEQIKSKDGNCYLYVPYYLIWDELDNLAGEDLI